MIWKAIQVCWKSLRPRPSASPLRIPVALNCLLAADADDVVLSRCVTGAGATDLVERTVYCAVEGCAMASMVFVKPARGLASSEMADAVQDRAVWLASVLRRNRCRRTDRETVRNCER